MFQTASPIHYPFLASQLLAFPRGSILISTYPWTARHLFRQENVLCKGESPMMCTLLAKWDWFFLRTFILTWVAQNNCRFLCRNKSRDILCIITTYCFYILVPFNYYYTWFLWILIYGPVLCPTEHRVYRRPRTFFCMLTMFPGIKESRCPYCAVIL